MKSRTLLFILMVGMAAIGCTSNQESKALRDVRQACINLGFGGSDSEDGSGDDGASTSKEWADLADSMDDTANTVARAARIDPRWNRLSNAVTDGQEWAKQMAIARDQTQSELDRSTAQEEADRLEPMHLDQVMRQECRKAQA